MRLAQGGDNGRVTALLVSVAVVVMAAGCASHGVTAGAVVRPQAVPSVAIETTTFLAPEAGRADVATSAVSIASTPPGVVAGSEAEILKPAEDARPVADGPSADGPLVLAQAGSSVALPPDDTEDLYDPWEPFNDKMFSFNLKFDHYVLKPTARVYKTVMPEPFQIMIANSFDNLRWVPRFVNNLFQGKFGGAGRELSRFLINSTAGIAGLFDPAKDYWGIQPSSEDFGQTLGTWGAGPGPYLVLPLLAPMTVRDGIGQGIDLLIDPFGYFVAWVPPRLLMKVGDTVNDRALNYDLFQGVEETTIDLYSSVRHFYLKRREQQIKE